MLQDMIKYVSVIIVCMLVVNKVELFVWWDLFVVVMQGLVLMFVQVFIMFYVLYGIQGMVDLVFYIIVDGVFLSVVIISMVGSVILQVMFVLWDSVYYCMVLVSMVLMIKFVVVVVVINFGSVKQIIQGFGGLVVWYYSKMVDDCLNVLFGISLIDSFGLFILWLCIVFVEWNIIMQIVDIMQWIVEFENGVVVQVCGVFVFVLLWMLLVSMKIVNIICSNLFYSGCLDLVCYVDYVKYLNSYICYVVMCNVRFYVVFLQNELDWDLVIYEFCFWSFDDMCVWIVI